MTFNKFIESLKQHSPPGELDDLLTALWLDARDELSGWDRAHKIVQNLGGKDAAWVHAYLHRKEGDPGNASYWYSRAGKPFSERTIKEEWEEIVRALIERIDP